MSKNKILYPIIMGARPIYTEDIMIVYELLEQQHCTAENIKYTSFGIIAYEKSDKKEILRISDIFLSRDKAEDLVQKCNRLNLSPLHIKDVIEDLL